MNNLEFETNYRPLITWQKTLDSSDLALGSSPKRHIRPQQMTGGGLKSWSKVKHSYCDFRQQIINKMPHSQTASFLCHQFGLMMGLKKACAQAFTPPVPCVVEQSTQVCVSLPTAYLNSMRVSDIWEQLLITFGSGSRHTFRLAVCWKVYKFHLLWAVHRSAVTTCEVSHKGLIEAISRAALADKTLHWFMRLKLHLYTALFPPAVPRPLCPHREVLYSVSLSGQFHAVRLWWQAANSVYAVEKVSQSGRVMQNGRSYRLKQDAFTASMIVPGKRVEISVSDRVPCLRHEGQKSDENGLFVSCESRLAMTMRTYWWLQAQQVLCSPF